MRYSVTALVSLTQRRWRIQSLKSLLFGKPSDKRVLVMSETHRDGVAWPTSLNSFGLPRALFVTRAIPEALLECAHTEESAYPDQPRIRTH